MGIDIAAETLIDRPQADVAAYVMDPANDAAWIGGITESKPLSEPPLAKGSKVQRVARFLGRSIHYVTEVIDHEPNALLVMHADSPFPMTIRYEFQDAEGGTLTRVRVQGEASGFFRLAAPLLAPAVRRNVSKDLERLKGLVEGDANGHD